MSAIKSREGKAIRFIEDRDFLNERGLLKGTFTRRLAYLQDEIPVLIRPFIATNKRIIEERSWNAFPEEGLAEYYHESFNQPIMVNRFKVVKKTVPNAGKIENIFDLPKNILSERIVEYIDVATTLETHSADQQKLIDACAPHDRPNLVKGWQAKLPADVGFWIYRYSVIDVPMMLVGGKIEASLLDAQPKAIINMYQMMYGTLTKWEKFSQDDARQYLVKHLPELDAMADSIPLPQRKGSLFEMHTPCVSPVPSMGSSAETSFLASESDLSEL